MKPSRVLSIDGGGMGVVLEAWIAALLEERAGRPLREIFDVIAGTSAGSLLGVGLGLGIPAAEIRMAAEQNATRIFPKPWWRWVRNLGGLRQTLYNAKGLDAALLETFGPALIRDIPVRMVIPAFDYTDWRGEVFNSVGFGEDLPAWQCASASARAPHYFPPSEILGHFYGDGGMGANHPGECGETEAIMARPGAPVLILSIGAGEQQRKRPGKNLTRRGVLTQAPVAISAAVRGSESYTHKRLKERLGKGYLRLDPVTPAYHLDETDSSVFEEMYGWAKREVDGKAVAIDSMLSELAA